MVFSFFKKQPEKMVAKPAAKPRAPAAEAVEPKPDGAGAPEEKNESAPDLPPLDFTSPSDFSDFSLGGGDIQVEHDLDPVQAEVEQVAVLFANGQDAAAKAMLEAALPAYRSGSGERLWLMLFDLYRILGQQSAFDALCLDYAKTFEKSPPFWRGESAATAGGAMAGGAPEAAALRFSGELIGANDAAFMALDQALDRDAPVRVDLSAVGEIDDLGCERMLGVVAKAARKKRCLELVGRDALARQLSARIDTGRRENPGMWLLLLEILQLQGLQDIFEETAINYAITFEMSPPSWDAKRVAGIEESARRTAGASAQGNPADDPVNVHVLSGEIRSVRFADLAAFADGHDTVIVDMAAVTRLDFVSAGNLANVLGKARNQGKRIAIRHPNHLVSELLGVVGVTAVAELIHHRN